MKDFCEFMEEDKKQQELNEKELKECFEFLEKIINGRNLHIIVPAAHIPIIMHCSVRVKLSI